MSARAKTDTLHTSRAGRRRLAAAMAGLIVLAQVLAFFHLALLTHSISPLSGRIFHLAGEFGGAKRGDDPVRDSSAEECQIFGVIQQAAALDAPCAGTPGTLQPQEQPPTLPDPGPLSRPWAIYLVAPSQSPAPGIGNPGQSVSGRAPVNNVRRFLCRECEV